jgi:pyrroloquinoline-quinone synthase
MELKHKLLDHPFYQAWTHGQITLEQLSKYHKSYNDFIVMMPEFWSKVQTSFGVNDADGRRVVADETEHIDLWQNWAAKLPATESFPSMKPIIDEFNAMTPSELLGAIQAFEIQQPAVAITKREGLHCHYGYTAQETVYFDEHEQEQFHIDYGTKLKNQYANNEEFQKGFDRGAELIYNGLDLFLN